MNVMLKTDTLNFEADERLKKSAYPSGPEPETVLGAMTGITASLQGVAYVLHCSRQFPIADDYYLGTLVKAAESAYLHEQVLWGSGCDTGLRGTFGLLGVVEGIEYPKEAIMAGGHRRARRQIRSAPDLYPELDIPGIEARAKELRECATDSEAISQALNQPVQVVHQAE